MALSMLFLWRARLNKLRAFGKEGTDGYHGYKYSFCGEHAPGGVS
jgi:hypothetical protein